MQGLPAATLSGTLSLAARPGESAGKHYKAERTDKCKPASGSCSMALKVQWQNSYEELKIRAKRLSYQCIAARLRKERKEKLS